MYTNTGCTVFNRVYCPETRQDKWQYSHIKKVFWEDRKGANAVKGGMRDADGVIVYIPFNAASNYMPPKEFERAPEGGFTLRPEDKIVKGLVEYMGPISGLSGKFDDVVTITSVDTMDYGSPDMQHWEVAGV